MKTDALVHMLSLNPIFSKVDEERLKSLVKNVDLVRLNERRHLFHTGDAATHFYLIITGSITLYRQNASGDDIVYQVAESGDLVAEMVMFQQTDHYPLTAQATCSTTCYRIPRGNLLHLCLAVPKFGSVMLSCTAAVA